MQHGVSFFPILLVNFIGTLGFSIVLPFLVTLVNRMPAGEAVRKVFGQELKDCYKLGGGSEVGLKDVFELPRVPFLLLLYFLIFLGFNFFYTAFPVHAVKELRWSVTEVGLFFSFLGGTMVLVQGPLLGKLGAKFSNISLTIAGAAILGTAFLFFMQPGRGVLYGGAALFSLGNGLMWPSFLALLAGAAGERFQGAVQGFGASVGSLASIVGLILGGILYETLSRWTFLGSAGLVYIVMALAFLYARRVSPSERST